MIGNNMLSLSKMSIKVPGFPLHLRARITPLAPIPWGIFELPSLAVTWP